MKHAQHAAPAYLYVFAWKSPVLDGRVRAAHRVDLPFVFDNTNRCAQLTGGTAEARALARRVSEAWVCFARTGDPNHRGLPKWLPFSPERVPTMLFDAECKVLEDHDKDARAIFAG
jgi:para-nitrobenzyl esterase